jgi:hypothetical protein
LETASWESKLELGNKVDGGASKQGAKLNRGIAYAGGDLVEDIGGWLFLGIVLAGFISAAVPADLFDRLAGNEPIPLVLMLLAGIALYICATASTPLAGAFILKGLSPGAALALLLSGPTTNMATRVLLWRLMGPRVVAVYLAAIAGCSLFFGWAVNRVYELGGFEMILRLAEGEEDTEHPLKVVSALVLVGLVVYNESKKRARMWKL